MSDEAKNGAAKQERTASQWIAAAIGLALTLMLIGTIAARAARPGALTPPAVTIDIAAVAAVAGGYRVAFVARNHGDETAAGVTVEGTLSAPGADDETSEATFDYVPGRSIRKGGLFFTSDPRSGRVALRALGYTQP